MRGFSDLAKRVIELHRPNSGVRLPEYQGCDAVPGVDGCPEWPCTTYSVIAMEVLDFEDVRKVLFDLTTASNGPATTTLG
jgi:hypothetical protein